MSRVERIIGISLAAIISVIAAACYRVLQQLMRLPQNKMTWWALETYTRFATVFGAVFLMISCTLLTVYTGQVL
ncbi:hypothetical protein EV286_1321 [Rhizobium sp. BK251]|nr:hypothetical protein EV286_1321 [Rhizobium sp. BK251]